MEIKLNNIPQHEIDAIKAKWTQVTDEEIEATKDKYESLLEDCRLNLRSSMNEEIKEIIGSRYNDVQREINELRSR